MCKGWVHFTVEALHGETEDFFDFLEKEFTLLEVDHSELEQFGVVKLLLQDSQCRWFVPSILEEVHTYFLQAHRNEDSTIEFTVHVV